MERQRQKILKEHGIEADSKEIDKDEKIVDLLGKAKSELRVDYLVTGSKVNLVNRLRTWANIVLQMVAES